MTSKAYKRGSVVQALREAGRHLTKAGEALTSAADTIEHLEKAKKQLEYVKEAAGPTKVGLALTGQVVKVKRDAMPKGIRSRAARLAAQVNELLEDARAVPVTADERLLQQRAKERRR